MEQPHEARPGDERPPEGQDRPPEHGDRPEPPRPKRHGKGRTFCYFLVMILLNILLAVYALYVLGLTMEFDWRPADMNSVSVIRVILMVILVASPLLLTIFLNKVVYRLFRGRRFFPRGTVLLAVLLIVAVQALCVMLILKYGLIEGATGIGMGEYVNFFNEITE